MLTNHVLKEAYDKHNVYYTEEDFVKKKGKSIPSVEKWGYIMKGLGPLCPFLIIFMMVLTANSFIGKCCFTSVIIFLYSLYENGFILYSRFVF